MVRKNGKPDYGKLWYNNKLVLGSRKFYILQAEKKRLIATGYFNRDLFRITY